jgi:uncharacterized protein (DUF1778 family)
MFWIMSNTPVISEVNIHLRARSDDRDLIDQAATLVGANRSQFMLASALKEARNILLDQTDITLNAANFQKVLAWLDGEPSTAETEGIQRLLSRKPVWADD